LFRCEVNHWSLVFIRRNELTALNHIAAHAADRELIMTRIFDAPQDLVFEVWTEPKHLVNWWGPNDFTLPFCEVDFRTGGSYRLCMHSPEGEDHWVWGSYREIVEPERIVFTWDREDLDGNPRSKSVVTVTFEAVEEKTRFTLRQGIFEFAGDCAEHQGGWTECLNRLARYVERA
jgi:uncharacterized protein YndB with AHSA1/START domain